MEVYIADLYFVSFYVSFIEISEQFHNTKHMKSIYLYIDRDV